MLEGRTKPPFASINRNLLTIPGRHGAFLRRSQKQPLPINQPIGFKVDNDMQGLNLKDELAEWLVTEQAAPLQFDDEPGRTYFAIVINTLEDFERMATLRQGTIQFLVLDGLGYSDETTQTITNNSFIINDGTAETYPIFEVDVLEPITSLEIRNKSIQNRLGENPSIVLGQQATVEQTEYEEETLIFHDTMNSTASWQNAPDVDVGTITGHIGVNHIGFYPEEFGDDTGYWQGPSLMKGIGESLTNFRADFYIRSFNVGRGVGLIDAYLRDANGNIITKVMFGDKWQDVARQFGRGQLGRYTANARNVDAHPETRPTWNQFDGIMRVIRKDGLFTFYFAQIDSNGNHYARTRPLNLRDNALSNPIQSVQVGFRTLLNDTPTSMHIKEIRIYRINQAPSNDEGVVPFIANPGDKITINTKTSQVRKNGEIANDLLDLQTRMFPLQKGYNRFEISNGINVKARYRKAYL